MRLLYSAHIGVVILLIAFGYGIGRSMTMVHVEQQTHLAIEEVQADTIPVVRVQGIRNGRIEGTVDPGARLFIGDAYIDTQHSADFSVDAATILTNIITVEVPSGMHFVASRLGKKYYGVQSAGGNRISVKNRVYFASEAQAQAAGYTK